MVYCSKCGTKNEDDRKTCVGCGAELYPEVGRKGGYMERKVEEECFGLPHGGAIAAIIIGLIIVISGLSWLFDFQIELWPGIVIVFGALIIAGAIYKLRKKR
jgi:uncharacterized membrane protein YvbJ